MGFFNLDDKAQLALIMAGLVGAGGAAGCGDKKPVVVDPVPSDARVEKQPGGDLKRDRPVVVDPPPRDMRVDGPQVVDMAPWDMRVDKPIAVDPAPWDMKVKVDKPKPVDPAPKDAMAGGSPAQPGLPPGPHAARGRALPINRSLRTQIKARPLADGRVELRAASAGGEGALAHSWIASGGELELRDETTAIWTPPSARGLHMVQVTARDGGRAISVDVFLHEIY